MMDLLFQYFWWRYGVPAILVGSAIYPLMQRLKIVHDIALLGGRAPSIKCGFLGIRFIYTAIESFQNNSVLDFWEWIYGHTGASAKGSYTAEGFVMGNNRIIFTADPDNIKTILTTQFADYGKGEQFHKEWQDFLGDSIFTTDGAQWHDSRQLIRPMFIRERVGHLDLFETHVQKLISLLGPGDTKIVKIDELLYQFTLDAATDFLFGSSVGSLGAQISDFQTAFNEVQRVQALISRAGALTRWLVLKKSFYEGLRVMEAFVEPYIAQALAMTPSELEQKIRKSETFVDALARFTRDRKVIRDQLVAVLIASRDTTAATLSWAFLELARNPTVVEKLRKDIIKHLGTNGRAPTYEEIKEMKYLTYVINETLRLYPAIPYNVRESLKDTTLPRGAGATGLDPVGLKAHTPVVYSTLMMQRRRDLYPPASETFPYDPLNWVPERWETWTPKSWQFIPFNGGPRICIGQNFAMTEMAYVLIRCFQTFETMTDYSNKPVLKADIVLTPGEGVKVGFGKGLAERIDGKNAI